MFESKYCFANKPKSEAEGARALLLIGTKENKTCVHRHGSKSSGCMFAGAGLELAQLIFFLIFKIENKFKI